MSCRSTKGGTATLRLVRRTLGLSDKEVTRLFHALKREGCETEMPSEEMIESWRLRLRADLEESDETPSQIARSDRDLLSTRSETYDGATFYALNMLESRARHEIVLQKISGIVEPMAEPGSQSDRYELDEFGVPTKVWYASYGSNIDEERFHTYLEGGSYGEGQISHSGSRVQELPEDETGVILPGRLLFASRSGRWGGGGIAFVDVDNEDAMSAGRAYKIQWSQFEDVLSQESGGAAGAKKVDWEAIKDLGEYEASGLYGRVVHVGDLGGAPVLTFTGDYSSYQVAPTAMSNQTGYRKLNQPHGNYVRTIGKGLGSTFNMSIEEQADYMRGALGGHFYSREEIIEKLNTPFEKVDPPKTYSSYSKGRARSGLSDSWRERSWETKRDYTPWWEDPEDPVVQRGSARDDEIPDWWWEEESEQDEYELKNWLSSGYDDVLTPEELEPMAFKKWDTEESNTPRYNGKSCVICYEKSHDMHNCPYM